MVSKKIVLHFSKSLAGRPIVYGLVKACDVEFNILKALITPKEEGLMILELTGGQEEYEKGIKYLVDTGVVIELLSQNIFRDEDKCTHCGAYVNFCPNGAFEVERPNMIIKFLSEECTGCKVCIRTCPARAMKSYL